MSEPLPPTDTLRRLKRSRTLHVTSLMATASFSLSACGPLPAAQQDAQALPAYATLVECKAANDVSDAECETAFTDAQKQAAATAPRYASREECEGQWGPSQCQPNNQGGGSFFTPLLAGFVVGQMLNGGYRGGALYRDRDNQYSNGSGGGYAYRDYRTGRTVANGRDFGDVAREAPGRTQSRTAAVSRGGFGGGFSSGYGG